MNNSGIGIFPDWPGWTSLPGENGVKMVVRQIAEV
jgi:hypothetical protein